MDDDTASFKEKRMYDDDERQTIQSLEESAHYYEKYIYRTLLNVEHAEEYSILAQQEQDKLRLEEEQIKAQLINEGQNPDEILA